MSNDCDIYDYYECIPGGCGFESVYVDVAMCLPAGISSQCGCYHIVKYTDGRIMLVGGDSVCKMFLNRRHLVHEHFKKYMTHISVKQSSSGVRYFSITN